MKKYILLYSEKYDKEKTLGGFFNTLEKARTFARQEIGGGYDVEIYALENGDNLAE